jgi:hypothetical protein
MAPAPAATIPPIPAKRKPRAKPKVRFTVCRAYRELPVKGGGVMRAEKGDYIVTAPGGAVSVMPPSVFRAEHPKLAR